MTSKQTFEQDGRDGTRDDARGPNRDPITGAPGAHPLGVGVGGIAGGAAAGAAAGTFLGPIGTLIGAAAGVVAGAAAGKRVAERIDPTGEADYWRQTYTSRPYVDSAKYDYDRDYAAAYGFGLQAREDARTAAHESDEVERARSWEASENTLKQEWDKARGDSRLDWDAARGAVQDAWNRADSTYDAYARSDAYHAAQFEHAAYREGDATYADYQPAYRYGTQARTRYRDRDWDDALEGELRQDWDRSGRTGALSWERAKEAVRDAFTAPDRYNHSDQTAQRGDRDRFDVS